jgi:hypothetical protein
MSKFQEISGDLLAIANLPPEKRNSALLDLSVIIQGWADYEMVQEQKDLISSIIEDLIAENDAEQIAKSKLVFVEDVEEQIAPTKKTRAKKVVTPVGEDLPDFIDSFSFVKDLPEPVTKLMNLRRKQDKDTDNVDLDATLSANLTWNNTSEGIDFWAKINNEGDLREFKKLYGNKGEKVDDLIEFAELNEFVEGLTQPFAPMGVSGDLPDTIGLGILIKDLPEPIKKLALFRQKEQNKPFNENELLIADDAFIWATTSEGADFWEKIEDKGDLTDFKRIYGNKGEGVDAIINTPAPAVKTRKPRTPKVAPVLAPVVAKQEVKYVELIFYPPSGGVLKLKVENPTELFTIVISILNKLNVNKLKIRFSTIADGGSYTTQVELNSYDSTETMLSKLVEQYDTFVKPELDWSKFGDRGTDIDRLELNEEILLDSFPKLKPVTVVTPKIVTPKPFKVVAPKVVTPKPVKVVAPKVVKTKVTKPKVEDDLSFLNDLENIF